ncbi:MAG: VWA domain-containing protein [Halosimplex sp.]
MPPTDDPERDDDRGEPAPADPTPEAAASVRADVLDAVVGFARELRAAGAVVPANAAVDAAAALAEVGWSDRETVRAATRAALLTREGDRRTFDRLFDEFWTRLRGAGREPPEALEGLADAANPPGSEFPPSSDGDEADGEDESADSGPEDDHRDEQATASATATVASEDGPLRSAAVETARYSPTGASESVERAPALDRHALAEPVDRLTAALAASPGRRRRRSTAGRFVDARRALRASVGTGGVVAELPESERAETAVRGVVLVDVSRSVLDSVDREFLLEWLRLVVDRWRSARVFFFDTDVREVTDAFDERTVGDVGDALADAEATWGGGTRIGHALATVRAEFPDAVNRRSAVLVVSDGLERGDVDDLAASAAWFGRRARLVLWLNPLAASPAYEPTARGMAAALPAVDGLFAFTGPDDVSEIARQLERHDRRRLGYEYDPRRTGAGADDRTVATDGSGTAVVSPAGTDHRSPDDTTQGTHR